VATKLRLPDFIIAGAPRSGTTWLYELLGRHPRIRMAEPPRPEPKFFLVDDEYAKGLSYYSNRWFAAIPEDAVAGEKSTNYMESKVAAERIANDLPTVQLIFVLRDPVERAVSNYFWSRRNGLETASLADALTMEADRERAYDVAHRYSRPYSYFSRGLYAGLLAPYFDLLPRDQILVLLLEEISANPSAVASMTHRFLNLEERPLDADGLGTINPSGGDYSEMTAVATQLRARYAEPNARLSNLLGRSSLPWPADGTR